MMVNRLAVAMFLTFGLCSEASSGVYSRVIESAVDFAQSIIKSDIDDAARKSNIDDAASSTNTPAKAGSAAGKYRTKLRCCTIIFLNPHAIGRLGDWLTAKRMTAMGYTKLPSRTNAIHGLDGVYVKRYPNGEVYDIVAIENKANSGRYGKHQMSGDKIREEAAKLLLHPDGKKRETGEILMDALENNPEILKKELWQHDLGKGSTKVYMLAEDGSIAKAGHHYKDNFIENQIVARCKSGSLNCEAMK